MSDTQCKLMTQHWPILTSFLEEWASYIYTIKVFMLGFLRKHDVTGFVRGPPTISLLETTIHPFQLNPHHMAVRFLCLTLAAICQYCTTSMLLDMYTGQHSGSGCWCCVTEHELMQFRSAQWGAFQSCIKKTVIVKWTKYRKTTKITKGTHEMEKWPT